MGMYSTYKTHTGAWTMPKVGNKSYTYTTKGMAAAKKAKAKMKAKPKAKTRKGK